MSFIDDFLELQMNQPRIALVASDSENSDYTNYAYKNKNCYLLFGSHYNEDSLYGQYIWEDKDCVDCDKVDHAQLAYECTYCSSIYNCNYLLNCFTCTDCEYGFDLVNCRNCFLSAGLRNVEYHIKNKRVKKEEYERQVDVLKKTFGLHGLLKELQKIKLSVPHVNLIQKNCENCFGSYVENGKNAFFVYNATNVEDCIYMSSVAHNVKDSVDCDQIGYDPSELLYECIGNNGNMNCNFCNACWHISDSENCELVFNSHHCFGCISRNHASFEILNQKYPKEEWFKRVAAIKDELKKQDRYATWLLPSAYPYEDTIAPLYF